MSAAVDVYVEPEIGDDVLEAEDDVEQLGEDDLGMQHEDISPATDDSDYIFAHLERVKKLSFSFKIHLLVAIIVGLIVLFIFHFATDDPLSAFWWWVYPVLAFIISLCAHYYFAQQKWWKGTVVIVIVFNVGLFMTWGLNDPEIAPWYIFPATVSAIALVSVYYLVIVKERAIFKLMIHCYWISSLFFFVTWLFYGQGFPWWIVPVCLLAFPVIFYRLKYVHKENRLWVLIGIPLVLLNVLLFLTWEFTTGWPWFFIPLIISGIAEGVLFWRWKKNPTTSSASDWRPNEVPEDNNFGSESQI